MGNAYVDFLSLEKTIYLDFCGDKSRPVFTVLALLQHAAAAEGTRTQASGRVRVTRHFGQRRTVKRNKYIFCCLFLPRAVAYAASRET